jgi:hypothetical protein
MPSQKITSAWLLRIGAGILLSTACFASVSCTGGARGVPVVDRSASTTPSATGPASEPNVQLGAFQELAGTDYLMAPIATPRGREELSVKSEDYRTDLARNYLFVNLTDKSSHLLLPTNDYLILEAKVLPAVGQPKEKRTAPATDPAKTDAKPAPGGAKWLYYRVVKIDTDNDKHLTGNDRWTVALSDVSGGDYKELIDNVEKILYETNRADNLVLIYRADGKNQIAEINLSTKQVSITRDLQEIQPK